MNLALSICLFETQDFRIGSTFFFHIFCMKLDSQKERKLMKHNFWKNVPWGHEGPEKPKNEVYGVWQTHNLLMFFKLEYKGTNGLLTFCKNHVFGKNLVLIYGPKTSKPIRMQDSSNYNISQTSWNLKLNFCMLLDIYKIYAVISSGVVRHAWACPKLSQLVTQLHLKNELSYQVGFFACD